MSDQRRLSAILDGLLDAWCERRALRPLAALLSAYPPVPLHTDQWVGLLEALRAARAADPEGLRDAEREDLAEATALAWQTLKGTGITELPAALEASKGREGVFAVVRVEADASAPEHQVTVKEVVRSEEIAAAEVERLNRLNADKGARYFYQWTRLFPEGTSAGTRLPASRPAV